MNIDLIIDNITQVVRLGKEDKSFLESILISRPFKQGELIIKSGDTAWYMMFMNAGMANEAGNLIFGEEIKLHFDIELLKQVK